MAGIPEFSPRVDAPLICHGCSKPMRKQHFSNNKGNYSRTEVHCDTCKYSAEVNLPFANMQATAYKPPAPEPLPHPSMRSVPPADTLVAAAPLETVGVGEIPTESGI